MSSAPGSFDPKFADIVKQEDIITLSSRLGESRYPIFGGRAYRELAEMVLLRHVPRVHFGGGVFRGFKHVLFYWQQSFWKSSLMESFFGLGSWQDQGLVEAGNVISPRSFTPERFRGSIVRDRGETKFLPPYPAVADVICIDELMGFIGTGESRAKMLSLLNSIMESGRGVVDLVKMGDLDMSDIPKDLRPKFHITTTGIEYDASASFVAATHTLHPRTRDILIEHGHISRYDVFAVPFGRMTAFDILFRFLENSERVGDSLLASVKDAWNWTQEMGVEKFNPPPTHFVHAILSLLKERDEILQDFGVSWLKPWTYIDGRFVARVCRKFIARALAKLPQRYGYFDFEYPELIYSETEDVEPVYNDVKDSYISTSTAFSDIDEVELSLGYVFDGLSGTYMDRVMRISQTLGLEPGIVDSFVRARRT